MGINIFKDTYVYPLLMGSIDGPGYSGDNGIMVLVLIFILMIMVNLSHSV